MQFKLTLATAVLFSISFSSLSAQSTASTSLNVETATKSSPAGSASDWSFYLDKENKVYFIDFETINVNLSDIKVTDQEGQVLLTDKLWDLPVDTIYEVSFKDFKPGSYKIELRSYTGVIEKEVVVGE